LIRQTRRERKGIGTGVREKGLAGRKGYGYRVCQTTLKSCGINGFLNNITSLLKEIIYTFRNINFSMIKSSGA